MGFGYTGSPAAILTPDSGDKVVIMPPQGDSGVVLTESASSEIIGGVSLTTWVVAFDLLHLWMGTLTGVFVDCDEAGVCGSGAGTIVAAHSWVERLEDLIDAQTGINIALETRDLSFQNVRITEDFSISPVRLPRDPAAFEVTMYDVTIPFREITPL